MSKLPTLLVPGNLKLSNGTISDEAPVKYIIRWLKSRMYEFGHRQAEYNDRILIIRAETGSGKSTVLPVNIFRIMREQGTPRKIKYRAGSVICTQPRILTTIALANDICAERVINGHVKKINPDMILGETVGYTTSAVTSYVRRGLIYATIGVLSVQLKIMADSDIMNKYKFIIVDEVHERSLEGDMTLLLLKNFYERNRGNDKLPFLILTSATINTKRYADYFSVGADNVIEVTGRTFPIRVNWPQVGCNDYLNSAVETAIKIHNDNITDNPYYADILIFMPGGVELTDVSSALRNSGINALILTVNSEVVISQSGDYSLIFERPEKLPGKPIRRIIISTVVAETGITIDTLKYVIDSGWHRAKESYYPWNINGLITRPVPKSRAKQRQGRVGRLFPGEFYPLYTKSVYESLDEYQLPDIITSGVNDILLGLVAEQQKQKKRIGVTPEFAIDDINLLDPPSIDAMRCGLTTAIMLGLMHYRADIKNLNVVESLYKDMFEQKSSPLEETRGYGLTKLGHLGAKCTRMPLEGFRIIIASRMFSVATIDLISIVATFGITMSDVIVRYKRSTGENLPVVANVLREVVPLFLLDRVMHGGHTGGHTGGDSHSKTTGYLPPSESEAFYFRTKLLIGDDFIELLLIIDKFISVLDTTDLYEAANWCSRVGVNFDTLYGILEKRDQIIEELLLIDINPFHDSEKKLSRASINDFLPTVTNIKRCLYEGLKLNILVNRDGDYYTLHNVRVQPPPLFNDAMLMRLRALSVIKTTEQFAPRYIITDQLRLKLVQRRDTDEGDPLLYSVETGLVSILDGYVEPDIEANMPPSI